MSTTEILVIMALTVAATLRVWFDSDFSTRLVYPSICRLFPQAREWTVTVDYWPPATSEERQNWLAALPSVFGWTGWRSNLHHLLTCAVCLSWWLSVASGLLVLAVLAICGYLTTQTAGRTILCLFPAAVLGQFLFQQFHRK